MSEFSMMPDKNEGPGSAVINLLCSLVLPVAALKYLTAPLNPTAALAIGLSFPLGYGIYDYVKNKKKNLIAGLGFINTLLTGGFALFKLEGIWFAVKEAAIPLAIGLFVYYSTYTKKPFASFIYNDALLKVNLIEEKLKELGNTKKFQKHLKLSTVFLSGSFFLSAILNFVLAKYIFTKIDPLLSQIEIETILNDQIAKMTGLSWVVIVIPSMICLMAIAWHLFTGIQKLTDLQINDFLNHK